MEFSVPNQCGTTIPPFPELLNPMTYHSKLPYPLPHDPKSPTNPNVIFLSCDPKKSTNPDDHLLSHDRKHSTNSDVLNPTLTEVPISIISNDVLPQLGTWKRF